jgi:hypothetical protein
MVSIDYEEHPGNYDDFGNCYSKTPIRSGMSNVDIETLFKNDRYKDARIRSGVRINPLALVAKAEEERREAAREMAVSSSSAEETRRNDTIIREQRAAIEMYISSSLAETPQEAIQMLLDGGVEVADEIIAEFSVSD